MSCSIGLTPRSRRPARVGHIQIQIYFKGQAPSASEYRSNVGEICGTPADGQIPCSLLVFTHPSHINAIWTSPCLQLIPSVVPVCRFPRVTLLGSFAKEMDFRTRASILPDPLDREEISSFGRPVFHVLDLCSILREGFAVRLVRLSDSRANAPWLCMACA